MWCFIFSPTRIGVLTACGFFLLSTNLLAELKTESSSVSLSTAISKTVEHNLDLQVFEYQQKAQAGKVQQAGLAPSPKLNVELADVFGTGEHTGIKRAQTSISIHWVLERGIRQHHINAAKATSSLLSSKKDIEKLDIAAETARRYLVSLAFQARSVNTNQSVKLAKETIDAVEKRVNTGRTPKAELFIAQAELGRRKLEQEENKHELLSANRQLAALWGETILSFNRVEGDITHIPQLVSYEKLLARIQQNPEFAYLQADRHLRQTELTLAQAKNTPSWEVKAGVRHIGSQNDFAFVSGISIPFGKRTQNPGLIMEAKANLAKIDLLDQTARLRIETALYVIHEKLQHNLHTIETIQNSIIPSLKQALKETRRAYNLGRYSYLELRSVQTELLNANNTFIEACIEAHQNIIEIERLTGVQLHKQS